MTITCNKSDLLEGLLITERGTTSKTTIPHLDGFLIHLENEKLIINTYDLEMGIEYKLKINNKDEIVESIVLPSKFIDIIRKLPEEQIELAIDNDNFSVDIKSGKAHFEVKGLDPNEYPSLPEISSEKTFSIPQNILKEMINQTSFAVSKDETKPAFTGILLRFEEEKLDMIATDSFRLAWKEGKIINDNEIEGEYIVPFKALTQISRIIDDDESHIKLFISDNYIICEKEDVKLFSKLIDEKFPNLEQVIPKNYLTLTSIDKKELLSAMERASLLASDGANNIIKLNVEEEKLTITSNSPHTGKLEEELKINKEGDNLNIALNAKFMIDVLKTLEQDSVNLEFSGAYSPLMLKTKEELSYWHLILPVRAL
ncbi:DNA polymerase III subunit beta [Natranaerofaba carboxydovora]|uniref:DNA polymerase III subunit beta n=1 Tax=Natranaerofaba carboxydovora TaxID=2742683 RepID=UPI001F12AA81|nr:DNA polymerase III subunit beta [Natranaerofaba carboxydovora]UMZ75188.1 DNA polymerase III subunit beta [Natranaerofaba carboxydovora]